MYRKFKPSPEHTIGVEIELGLVDKDSKALVNDIDFLLDAATRGVRGRITDPAGHGVAAWILSDQAPWPAHADPETGAFARPLQPGEHTLTIGAPGYETSEVTVSVPEEAPAELDIFALPDNPTKPYPA